MVSNPTRILNLLCIIFSNFSIEWSNFRSLKGKQKATGYFYNSSFVVNHRGFGRFHTGRVRGFLIERVIFGGKSPSHLSPCFPLRNNESHTSLASKWSPHTDLRFKMQIQGALRQKLSYLWFLASKINIWTTPLSWGWVQRPLYNIPVGADAPIAPALTRPLNYNNFFWEKAVCRSVHCLSWAATGVDW